MDGVKIDEFGPSSFLWLGLGKNSLKKVKLLEINLWVPSDWEKKKKKKRTSKAQSIKQKERPHILYNGCILEELNIPKVLSTGMCSVSSG